MCLAAIVSGVYIALSMEDHYCRYNPVINGTEMSAVMHCTEIR